ncbi:MAG: alkylglycerol monooxygenase [Myxococcota bacterium]|jgi:alkylglycerol monooxygenase
MDQNLIAWAIPFFFVLIAIEVVVARKRGLTIYRFEDALTCMGCGITQQVVLIAQQAALLGLYVLVWTHFALVDFDTGPTTWIVSLLLVDFIYYWWHRLSHGINFLWAAHVVHHQSEDYNLAVALRQSMLTSTTSLPFYLPMAVLGIPPVIYAASRGINTVYQFWVHTELVRSTGPLEAVLNTPSHHRVHHGINPRYLDKNHAGMLIIWDRMFGTFEPETEPVVYGVVAPLGTYNAVSANWKPLTDLWALSRSATRWQDRLKAFVMDPPWRPDGPPKTAPEVDRATFEKFELHASKRGRVWATLNFVLTGTGLFLLLLLWPSLQGWTAALAAGFVFTGPLAWGGLFHARRWVPPLELARWGTALYLLALLFL